MLKFAILPLICVITFLLFTALAGATLSFFAFGASFTSASVFWLCLSISAPVALFSGTQELVVY